MSMKCGACVALVLLIGCKSHDEKLVEVFERGNADLSAMKKELAAGASPNVVEKGTDFPILCRCMGWDPIREDAALALVDAGANPNAICDSVSGAKILQRAAGHGAARLVRALLAKGADKDAADVYGARPLYEAACGGYPEVVQILRDAGASTAGRVAAASAASCARFKIGYELPGPKRTDYEKVLTLLDASAP